MAAQAHAMIDETIDLADAATTRDEALRAKIAIDARWQAASKYIRRASVIINRAQAALEAAKSS